MEKRLDYLSRLLPPQDEILKITRAKKTEEKKEDIDVFEEELHKKFPAFIEANEIIGIYESSEDKKERKEACRTIIRKFFTEPKFLENFYVQIERHKSFAIQNGEERADYKIIEQVERDIENLIEESLKKEKNLRFSFKEKKEDGEFEYKERLELVQEWLRLSVENDSLKGIVEKIIRVMFENIHGVEEFTYNLHALSYVTLRQGISPEAQRGLDFLSFDTDVLPSSEKNADLYVSSLYSLDDELLKRALDIDGFYVFAMSRIDPKRLERRIKSLTSVESGVTKGIHFKTIKRDALADPSKMKKAKAISEYYSGDSLFDGLKNTSDIPEEKLSSYPYNLIWDPKEMTSMRRLLNRMIAINLAKEDDSVIARVAYNPLDNREVTSAFSKDDNVRRDEILALFRNAESRVVDVEAVFETVSLLFPTLDEGSLETVRLHNQRLTEELRGFRAHSVGARGDKVIILNEDLKKLGFDSITFKPRESILDLDVIIRVGNIDCKCSMGSKFVPKFSREEEPSLITQEAYIIVTEIILSNLHKILCDPKFNGSGGSIDILEDDNDGEKQVSKPSIRAHRRKLPAGKCFTTKQAIRALEKAGIDLSRINMEYGYTREDGQLTYVVPEGIPFKEAQKMDPLVISIDVASKVLEAK